ncbi:PaaI family thioesterase [Tistrella bauzanensis]|jgi:uncharacterized protein (TIGR00369 family)|uniref:PaaI family thioesterase n=1 Tax=Tistrella arctica TaxID=3133430 RepID=A0ABU9YFQ3_9PROT
MTTRSPPPSTDHIAPPDGFTPHFRDSPLTDPWKPLWSRIVDRTVILGLWLAVPHTNSRGLAHGGLISALADNAMGLSCALQLPEGAAPLTVSLSVDFIGSGRIGQWLAVTPQVIRAGGTLGFAQCLITADGAPIARGSATFHVARR